MVSHAREEGFNILVVDGSPQPSVAETLRDLGAVVVTEPPGLTMGASRRLALREAGVFGTGAHVWLEPEKSPLIPWIRQLCAPIFLDEADITVPARAESGFASYPAVQRYAEECGNAIFAQVSGQALDMWFGPRAMNPRGVTKFLSYDGRYGDRWDAIFIPVLRAIREGLRVLSVPVEYQHPPEQTEVEARDVDTGIRKRLEQLTSLAQALCTEARELGFLPGT